MEIQKAIKKVIALGTGAAMVGATIMGAAAVGLENYPGMFVTTDGKLDALFVLGAASVSADTIGAVDIATHMTWNPPAEGTEVTVEGDAWKVGTSSKLLEMSEDRAVDNAETLYNISTYIGEDELDILADGEFDNDKGTYAYKQNMYFHPGGSTTSDTGYVVYLENDNDETADFLYFRTSTPIVNYTVEFTTDPESDVTNAAGTASTSGSYLWNLEGEQLTFLGKEYSIVQARRSGTLEDNWKLIMMGGAVKDIMSEGETKTYTVDDVPYEVVLSFVGATSAKFVVNGEITDSITEGGTDKLSDGTTIGVRDIMSQEFTEGLREVEFYLGAQKIEIKDTEIEDDTASSNVLKVNDETVDDVDVVIEGNDDNTTAKLGAFKINLVTEDDYYLPAGGKLSEILSADQLPALLGSWDIEYKGLEEKETEELSILTSGSDQYKLKFMDGDGNQVTVPLVYTAGTTQLKAGDNDNNLLLDEAGTSQNATGVGKIQKNDYFIVTDASQTAGNRPTYALRYKGADKSTASNRVVKVQNLGTGETMELSVKASNTTNFKLGGQTFKVGWDSTDTVNDFSVYVDLNGDGSFVSDSPSIHINTKHGAEINLSYNGSNAYFNNISGSYANTSIAGSYFVVRIDTPDGNDYDNMKPGTLEYNLTAASGQVVLTATNNSQITMRSPEGSSTISYGYTHIGAFVTKETPTSAPSILKVDYPYAQRAPLVYVVGKGVVSTGAATGTETAITIPVGATVFDTEIADKAAQNMIVVGGPCANTIAADIMGNPAVCTEGFEPGMALLKLAAYGDKYAMLIAGGEARDTQMAAKVLANSADYALSGMEMEVMTLDESNLVVQVPTAEEPETEEETPTE